MLLSTVDRINKLFILKTMNKVTYDTTLSPKIKLGQFYRRNDLHEFVENELYIVSRTVQQPMQYFLVCLEDGILWTNPTDKIEDIFGDEDERGEFTLVTNPFTITPDNA
jgi:hypothetical protein